ISPDEFIPIAEKNGSIIKIGEYVFEEVCRLYTENKLYELGIEFIEVNLSVVQCMNKKLGESFSRILEKYNLDASHINLEITESAAASNQRTLIDSVVELNNLGFTFSLDDYGTGYSNFSYMLGMPFSIIKLDRSILWSAMNPKTGMQDENAMMFLESTMHMMRRMNYKIVVEGVETIEQKKVLEEFRCDYIQGFYFSKPVPEDIFIDYVKQANAAI
ncbi:MAG: EAL domain-containing protein, partial [Lachnospiraceae bacterium]|nr:EAL domain-containing protein [Lachnospiraceae bacterium]